MTQMTNEETDTALLLENELKRRVRDVVRAELALTVGELVKKEIDKNKEAMMTEITLAIGKALQNVEKDQRKPLWEAKPEDFNLTEKDMETFETRDKDLWRI